MTEGDAAAMGRTRARWTRLAALGLVLAAVGPLLMLGAGRLWGLEIGEEVVFFLITAAVALIGALLVWRLGVWGSVLGILAAVLVALGLFWTAFGLTSPTSFFDFVPGVLVIPGALLALVSSIAAIVARRRGHLTASATGGERSAIRIALTVVAGLAIVSGVLTVAARSRVDEAAAADLTVRLSDFEFDQPRYEATGGARVLVRNSDPFLHTFTIDALDIDVAFTPGSEKIVEIPSRPGTYVVYCRPHTGTPEDPGEGDMAADFVVG